MEKIIFHLDMDAFYASVEQNDHPQYRGKPVIIGGAEGRGVVSACSYEARKFGVHSAMPGGEAKRRCPNGIFLPVNMQRYQRVSKEIMSILNTFSPDVHQISVDEAFIDMSGTQRLLGSPLSAAEKIKQKVVNQTGLTISIGIAPNHLLAKMASDFNKPDGVYRIKEGEEISFIDRFTLGDIWGIGQKGCERLKQRGLIHPRQIRNKSLQQLQQSFSPSFANYLYHVCQGKDPGILNDKPVSRSVSNEITFRYNINDPNQIKEKILSLSHQVMFRLLDNNESGKTLSIKIRYPDFQTLSIQTTERRFFKSGEELYRKAVILFEKKWIKGKPIRLIGLCVTQLCPLDSPENRELFDDEREQNGNVEKAILQIMKKGNSIQKASLLNKKLRK